VGSEVDTLLGSLERQRATFAYKCADLTADQLRSTVAASSMTLGGLLKHLAYMEDLNFTRDLAGERLPAPWAEMDPEGRGERVWRSAADDEAADLYTLWENAVSRSRAVITRAVRNGGPSATFEVQPGVRCTVRRLIVDFIEEYGRHTGHADLLRESIDGRVGEDPPGERYPFTLE
jgi:Protein of unknown function (DUF664)